MRKFFVSLFTLLSFCLKMHAGVEPIILTSPDDYQVMSLSPNGRWATGVYVDDSQNTYAFLWNLESNNIQLLSTLSYSYGNSVSNEGIVVGHFGYTPSDGQATFEVPGYYKDGAWHPVELPTGIQVGEMDSAGRGWGITPDGTRMSGTLLVNNSYTPFVWDITKDGAIVRQLDISNPDGTSQHGIATCISPNGLIAGGWAYRYNRSNVLWDVTTGQKQYIGKQDTKHQGFYAQISKFSPDGKKAIFAGGWDENVNASANPQWGYAIYDLETGDITELPTVGGGGATIAVYGISNDYTVVGANSDFDAGRAVIYKASDAVIDPATGYYKTTNAQFLEDYLINQGVDFSNINIYLNPYSENCDRTLFRGQDISADGNIICVLYYADVEGYAVLRSMIVMLNQSDTHAAPQDIQLRQMAGLNTAEIVWSAPVRAVDGIRGYAIYRDGVKVATLDNTTFKYYDRNLDSGVYSYSVASVYDDEETMSSTQSITVAPHAPETPWGLFLRQKGINSIYCQWEKPATNLITKNWYNARTANISGFGVGMSGAEIEMGVRFPKDELALYEGCRIASVNFVPLSQQQDVKMNIYCYDAEGNLQLLHTQNVDQALDIRENNKVMLDEPLALPLNSDVVVSFSFYVETASNKVLAIDYGRCTPGYTDLIRFVDEADFYSYGNMSAENGTPDYLTFMIDMVLMPEGTDSSVDDVKNYVVFMDGEEIMRTENKNAVIQDATLATAASNKTVAVAALYENGMMSETISGSLPVKAVFVGVDDVKAEALSSTSMQLSWNTPLDVDTYSMTYSGQKNGTTAETGIKGPQELDYGLVAAASFPQSYIKGYDGYRVKSFKFYPTGNANFTFFVYQDNVIVNETPVTDYTLDQWNEIPLDDILVIDEHSTYTLALNINDVMEGVAALAIDNTTPFVGVGDMYSLGDTSWESVSTQTGVRGNWMIGMELEEQEQHEASVSGYDVYISKPGENNATKVNSQRVTDNTYIHDFGQEYSGQGKMRIATFYNGRNTVAASGTLCDYVFDSTDIRSLTVSGVKNYSIHSGNGTLMRSGNGSQIDISGLRPGVYVISLTDYNDNKTTQKITIK